MCVCNKVSSFFSSLIFYWLIKHYFSSVGGDNTHFLWVENIFIWCDQLIYEWGKNLRRRTASRRTTRLTIRNVLASKIWLTKNVVCGTIRRNNNALSVCVTKMDYRMSEIMWQKENNCPHSLCVCVKNILYLCLISHRQCVCCVC